jgi:hypothetical protein
MQTTKMTNVLGIIMVGLIAIIVILAVALGQAWKNERFLDAELNKYTTTSTNHIK